MVLPVYEAGETPIENIHSAALAAGLQAHGHHHALNIETADDLPAALAEEMRDGDVILCMGAGSISQIANELPEKLEALAK
jgi:UDP-N-acetylmuramate--alanine ligase